MYSKSVFRKIIAVLLLLSIVLSSCGKKDKDKSNDFVRVVPESSVPAETSTPAPVASPAPAESPAPTTTPSTPLVPAPAETPPSTPTIHPDSQSLKTQNKEDVKSLDKAVNDCINIHLSCSVPSEACRKAQAEDKDPKRSNTALWQQCIDSPPCSEKREAFLKAKLACLNSEIDYNKAHKSCREGLLACPVPEVDCPEAELACDKTDKEYPKTELFCPGSSVDCPEAELACDKSDLTFDEAKKICDDANQSKKACNEANIVFYDSQVQCLESHKACAESELNGTSSEDEEEDEEKEELEEEEEVVAAV